MGIIEERECSLIDRLQLITLQKIGCDSSSVGVSGSSCFCSFWQSVIFWGESERRFLSSNSGWMDEVFGQEWLYLLQE